MLSGCRTNGNMKRNITFGVRYAIHVINDSGCSERGWQSGKGIRLEDSRERSRWPDRFRPSLWVVASILRPFPLTFAFSSSGVVSPTSDCTLWVRWKLQQAQQLSWPLLTLPLPVAILLLVNVNAGMTPPHRDTKGYPRTYNMLLNIGT
jgi:hypothetical protein